MARDDASASKAPVLDLQIESPMDRGGGDMTHFRWVILTLVFLGTTVNYMDRQILGFLAPHLKDQLHLFNNAQYGYIQSAFALSYALGQMVSGRWLDWIGTRVGYALALSAWSVTSILHVVARTAMGFAICRVLLGVAESPNFPAAVKTLAEWFPKRERAFAMGVVNTGTIVGAVLVPLCVPFLLTHSAYGWQSCFIVTGACGMIWLALWIPLYRRPEIHPAVSPTELALIRSDPPESVTPVRWARLITYPQAWAFMIGKFLTDPLWWFYMSWFPDFLSRKHGVRITDMGKPLIIIYGMAALGSMAGGWFSSALIKRGWSVNAARKTALLVCAVVITPMIFTTRVQGMGGTIFLLGLAVAAHQGFSSNLYTLVSDMFPKQATGSVSGLGGACGYGGASLFSAMIGLILGRWTHENYTILFLIAGLGYLLAFLIIQILVPRLTPANLDEFDGRGSGLLNAPN